MLISYPKRSGYTFLELLVLLGIFFVVILLAVPAVGKAREASGRVRCANNLRLFGEACCGFENTYGFFPSSIQDLGPQRSWAMQILPWIEQEELVQLYDYEKPWYDPANAEAVRHQVPLFYCPASPYGPRTAAGTADIITTGADGDRVHNLVSFADAACSDYAVVHQVRPEAFVRGFVEKAGLGMLAHDRFPRRVDVSDGLGNTLMVSEAAGQPDEWMRGRRTGSSVLPQNAVLAARDNDFSLRGFTWDAATQTYSNVHSGPCAINCSNVEGVYSFHHGGAQAVFGDGSVRFLRQEISTFLLARLVTRAGGEMVDWNDY